MKREGVVLRKIRQKLKLGYCGITADFLHIGHINFITKCAEMCDKLMVGVMSDDCVLSYKGKSPIMNQDDRIAMIKTLRMVDLVIVQNEYEFDDIINIYNKLEKYDLVIFDSEEHKREGADIFFPRHNNLSSTMLKEAFKL